jgi:adenosylhomocysteine nucleosidase
MFDKKETLILVAMEEELPKEKAIGWNIIYTGVGKINASISIADSFYKYRPKKIVNYGSAGAINKEINGLHEVTEFYQRDMDAREIGFTIGTTPFDNISKIKLSRKGISCSSGDNFVTKDPLIKTDIVDMESYALAKFCKLHKLDFYCFKFISDKANKNAANDWNENFKYGSSQFMKKLESMS